MEERKANRRRPPVNQSDLDTFADILGGRDGAFGTGILPKATFLFGPDDKRRSALVRPTHPNSSLVNVVHMVISDKGLTRRLAIESAWVKVINPERGTITFTNDSSQTLRLGRSGRVTSHGLANQQVKIC